jgi:hypothetical protein
VSNTDTIKCPECGIESHVEASGSEKSFSFSQEEMARKCKTQRRALCPNIRRRNGLDSMSRLDTGSSHP